MTKEQLQELHSFLLAIQDYADSSEDQPSYFVSKLTEQWCKTILKEMGR